MELGNWNILTRTRWTHLGDTGHVGLVLELRGVVVDVLDLNDELRLGLLRLVGPAVDGLSLKDIEGFFFPIQLPERPDFSGILVYLEHVAGSLS